jgi:hypothetical protein
MNVLYLLTTVIKTQAASTFMDLFNVVVVVDILGMERIVRVIKEILQYTRRTKKLQFPFA